jgi:hypothetical protein
VFYGQPVLTAFVDESSRLTDAGYCYVVAAAVVVQDEEDVRDAVRKLPLTPATILHWHSESNRRRREIVERVGELHIQAIGAGCHPVAAKRQERARARLLTTLVADLAAEGVGHVVIEARQERLNRRDRSTLIAAKKAEIISGLTYEHVDKRDEPLLWLADVLAGALSLHLAGDDSTFFVQLGTSLLHVRTISP